MAIGDGVAVSGDGADLSFKQKSIKYVIAVINLAFLIFGIVLIALGAAAIKAFSGELTSDTLPDGIIVLGVFILLVSLFGFFSAYREWRAGLGVYFGIVLLLAIILISVSIAIYVEKNQSNILIANGWNSGGIDVQLAAMAEFTCCGLVAITEFNIGCASGVVTDPNDSTKTATVPTACCLTSTLNPNSPWNSTNPKYQIDGNANPCEPILVDDYNKYAVGAGGAGIAFSVLMIVALVFIGLLMKGIRLKNLNLEVMRNRQRNDAERAERRKGIQLPDNVL